MLKWHYRILKSKGHLFIVEVFYDKGKIISWTHAENPCYPTGMDLKELKQDFKYMMLALQKPILTEAQLYRDLSTDA